MNDKRIEITLEEYKELLIIKGKYDELKEKRNDIIYIPYKINEPQPYVYPWNTNPPRPTITYKTTTERGSQTND